MFLETRIRNRLREGVTRNAFKRAIDNARRFQYIIRNPKTRKGIKSDLLKPGKGDAIKNLIVNALPDELKEGEIVGRGDPGSDVEDDEYDKGVGFDKLTNDLEYVAKAVKPADTDGDAVDDFGEDRGENATFNSYMLWTD